MEEEMKIKIYFFIMSVLFVALLGIIVNQQKEINRLNSVVQTLVDDIRKIGDKEELFYSI
jgi:hypothetical protein